MPDPTDLQAPYLDPSAYPDYLDVQRKQMVTSMLLNAMQNSGQTPANWDQMRVVPRRGIVQNLAPILTAAMAAKSIKGTQQAEQNYFGRLYGGGDNAQGQSAPLPMAPAADPNEVGPQPLVARNGQTLGQVAQGSRPQGAGNPMLLTGQPGTSQMLLGLMGPQKYGEELSKRYAPLDIERQLTAAGITDPLMRRQIIQGLISKGNYIPPVDVRPGGTLVDPMSGQPTFTAPNGAIQTQWGPQGPTQSLIPGALPSEAAVTGTQTGAKEANTPHYEPDPFHPGQMKIVYPPTPPALGGTPPGAPQAPHPAAPPSTGSTGGNTALDLEQQKQQGKSGAESGQAYSDQLVKNATSATEVRRSLSELRNLAASGGVSVANPAKLELGSYLIAAGMDPKNVSSMLGTDLDALTAASKQTGSLALDSIHDMTSRGTNFDLATFMKYNPNLNMATQGGFSRVLDFMDRRMQQEVGKQADFDQWSRNVPANRWASGHTSHWLQLQNQMIDKGKTNSRPPLSSFVRPD